jgi:glutaredoxin/glutathione-dependent peroxiredoxin
MRINVGDRIPDSVLTQMAAQGPQPISTADYFSGRKIVLFSVPGAFTPTCSAHHLPGFVERAAEFSNKGIDAIACMAVNDVFVMHAWGESSNADGIDMLADGNGEFAAAMGLDMDASAFGMGKRAQRFALVADDGVVTQLRVEAPGEFRVSSAESIFSLL